VGYHDKPLIGGGQESAFIDTAGELHAALSYDQSLVEDVTLWLTADSYSGGFTSLIEGEA
jgi:hypothetical protein